MRQELFGMRRANGDWFVLDLAGARRVVLFPSLIGAWRARAKNDQLMLFWPAPVEPNTLTEFATADKGRRLAFGWLTKTTQRQTCARAIRSNICNSGRWQDHEKSQRS